MEICQETGTYIETGEIKQVKTPSWRIKGGFAMLSREAMATLSKSGLKGREHDVLLQFLSRVDWDNLSQVTQHEIADELGMHRPAVARAVKSLVEKGILKESRPAERGSVTKQYFINLKLCTYGQNAIKRSNSGAEFSDEPNETTLRKRSVLRSDWGFKSQRRVISD